MNLYLKYAVVIIWFVPTVTFSQSASDTQSFKAISDSMAYELGRAYQMGRNCNKELSSISPPKAAGLFINYMKEPEVQQTMSNYENGLKSKSEAHCDAAELKVFMPALQTRLANYIKIATPFMRPYSEH
ncbi:MAG: hypothetical protein ABIN99_13685 [Nitrosospira sp.]